MIKFRTIYIFLIGFMLSGQVVAQKVLLDQQPPAKGTEPDFGPNEKYFLQMSFGSGFLIGSGGNGLAVNNLRSDDFKIGIRFKRKISGLLSFWLEPEFRYSSFNINQGNQKTFMDSIFWGNIHNKHQLERFATECINLNAFFRINFDPNRGNFMGYYLDLGYKAGLNLGREYLTEDQKPDGSILTSSYTKLPYLNPYNYGVFAKIGINWIALTFDYRLSSIFKSSYSFPEPPIYSIGVEVNPYSH